MSEVFTDFQRLNGTTWFYLSLLLALAVFFRFTRFFYLRNWDLITLFLVVPGLLATNRIDKRMLQILDRAREVERIGIPAKPLELEMTALRPLEWGYVWLFIATGYLFLRCALDVFIARRPKVDPNLDISGMACLGCALFGFLMFEVVTKEPDPAGRASATVAQAVLAGQPRNAEAVTGPVHPTTTFFHAVVAVPYGSVWQRVQEQPLPTSELIVGVARSAAILAHLL
ncbi:MAG TPA: hypothetical protein VNC50_14005, partial [Planctomycetia bacterium]|nr:hypothetical protein [Planctomycetia bacterium]